MVQDDKMVIDLTVLSTASVQEVTVQEWWDELVDSGVDPEEDHIAVTDVHIEENEVVVRELARGNLMECLVAASKVETFVRVLPMSRYDEVARELN